MQVVSDIDFDGHKLLLDGPTQAKAEMVVRALNGAHALVGIDNLTNYVDTFMVFAGAPNVTVVAADRDYNLSSSLHRLDRRSVRIIDVTDLSDADLQDLRSSIPMDIRRPSPRILNVSQGVRPSLFEFIQANVQGPTLRARMEKALERIQKADALLAEMLLLVSYVHSCRTPLSMDMAIGYWSGRIDTHDQIYSQIKGAGALLNEYEGDLADGDQDYFAARSVLAAECVMNAASGSQLGAMLTRFHTNISHTRITAYYVFKRRAYDSKLFGRAFVNITNALNLYDEIYARDPSPYTLQQKALFLASRKRFSEAFEEMDRAVSTAHRANWTIRSSYAQILFQANQDLAGEDPKVRGLLDRAMTMLTDCYRGDRRRSMHAVVYGTLAVRYAAIFKDTTASDYLTQAELWLLEVIRDEPWVRQAQYLRRDVQQHLRELA
jgi:tetratricopeptide (TPR) repeat protein